MASLRCCDGPTADTCRKERGIRGLILTTIFSKATPQQPGNFFNSSGVGLELVPYRWPKRAPFLNIDNIVLPFAFLILPFLPASPWIRNNCYAACQHSHLYE